MDVNDRITALLKSALGEQAFQIIALRAQLEEVRTENQSTAHGHGAGQIQMDDVEASTVK